MTPVTSSERVPPTAQTARPKPEWHRQPCPDCGKPLIFQRISGQQYRPDSETRRWHYRWHVMCRCGFEATVTTPGGPVYKEATE